ncbi:MAG: tRNA (guanosine(46)-N7)-methyltransferase TrmB [Planctomycetes bacterium]|nr:tRNA (guanosine(46)-N7)-methyltransferase TrmB [Planctomycetota bacterium]
MPRRGAKKPDRALDVSWHLLRIADLPTPCFPAELFPTGASPVELEVGSGKGLFLATAAAAQPQRLYLGTEIAFGYARLAAGRLARARLTNARVAHGDAGLLVRSGLPDGCLAAVHVYFPDPWWKARHKKRRVLSAIFLDHVGRVLGADGVLHVWTDVEEYFRESLDLAAATGCFAPPRDVPATEPTHDLDYRTHFERRTRLAGAPVWRAALVRTGAAARVVREERPSPPPG